MLLSKEDYKKIERYLTNDTVNMEIKEFSKCKREVMLEYKNGKKLVGNLNNSLLNFKMIELKGLSSVSEHFARGYDGNNKYRGNWSGKSIEDFMDYYKLKYVYDPFAGGGTTGDTCKRKGIECKLTDLNPKYGGIDVYKDGIIEKIPKEGAIMAHLPYYSPEGSKMPRYSGVEWGTKPHPSDGSWIKDWSKFTRWMNKCVANMYSSLEKGSRMILLMGDTRFRGKYYSMFKNIDVYGEMEGVVIKKQYNCWSDSNKYNGKFIPTAHEYFLIINKKSNLIIPCIITRTRNINLADKLEDCDNLKNTSWRGIIDYVIEKIGGKIIVQQLGKKEARDKILNYLFNANDKSLIKSQEVQKKLKLNKNIGAKIRQITNEPMYKKIFIEKKVA